MGTGTKAGVCRTRVSSAPCCESGSGPTCAEVQGHGGLGGGGRHKDAPHLSGLAALSLGSHCTRPVLSEAWSPEGKNAYINN